MRIGHGYDAHILVADRALILGGVTIPYDKGLLAHSDGDAVIHAFCDALLGAAGLGDIGQHFPDTDERYRNADSRILLERIGYLLKEKGLRLINADITILAEQPRLSPYLQAMRENLAHTLNTQINNINLKATTTEGMGFIGRQEGIAVHAVALLS